MGNLGLNATVSNFATNNTPAVAFLANPASTPSPPVGPTPLYPPVFASHAHAPTYFYPVGPPSAPAHSMPFKLAQQFTSSPILGQTQLAQSTTQATLLPQAFTARTLHDPYTGAWNMDTGASSHLNNFVLLRCDSTGDLYPVTAPSPIPHAFLVIQHT
ncbi:hypothetical protein Tco_0546207 [Tanacetum coccineum]